MRVCPACGKTFEDDAIYCTECGKQTVLNNPKPSPAPPPTPTKKNRTGFVILTIIFALTTVLFGYMYFQEKSDCNYYENKYRDARASYNALKDETDFMDDYIRIVSTSTEDGFYHKYGCKDLDTESFLAYNINAAEAKGYNPCPECCK